MDGLLVPAEQGQQFVVVEHRRQPVRQAVAGHHPAVGSHPFGVDAAQPHGHLGRVHEADGHRLAVAQVVASRGLDGVGQRVAVVEDGPPAPLALIGRHHLGLDAHCGCDPLVGVEGIEVVASQEVVLGQLTLAAAQLPRRQRGQHLGVAQHGLGLPERADEVLALGQVDSGLAPDGRVHLGQQRGGHRHIAHAAVVDGSHEARQVGDHSPADGHDHVGAGEAGLRHGAAEPLDLGQRLGLLAVGDGEHRLVESAVYGPADACLGDHRGSARPVRHDRAEPGADSPTDMDVVGAVAQRDGHNMVMQGGRGHSESLPTRR